ncbi:MAG: ABC transporter ATP-binding protein [Gammaproteobacteria bacterium]|nr:ABC transporter ATP-binding protein [Gammaproteobacteria bacterium]
MRKPVIELKSINKTYNRTGLFGRKKQSFTLPAIENLSLTLREGEILGLIGESGSGKTTAGKSILKLTDIDSGSIHLYEQDITDLSENKFRPMRTDIQMIFQDLDAALNPNMKINNILTEILTRHHKENKNEINKRLLKLIEDVHLDPKILERFPAELSGGQKRRIAIASALAVEPKIIIADEPTTGLDNYTQSLIMQLILDLQKNNNLSMILISHDLQLVKKMCQRIAVMYLGNIIELGTADEVSQKPAHPYSELLWQSHLKHTATHTNITRKHDIKSGLFDFERPGEGCRFSPRCKRYLELGKPDKCISKDSRPDLITFSSEDEVKMRSNENNKNEEHIVACHFPL